MQRSVTDYERPEDGIMKKAGTWKTRTSRSPFDEEGGSDFDDDRPWRSFMGHGKVFVTRGTKVASWDGMDFNAERLDKKGKPHGEFWIHSEAVVAFGDGITRKQAIRA